MFAPLRIGFKELEEMESNKRKGSEFDGSSSDDHKIQKLDLGPIIRAPEMDEILGSEIKTLTDLPPNVAENNTATTTLEDPKCCEASHEPKILHLEETNRILQEKVLDLESKLVEQTGTVCHITGSRDEYAMKLSEANGRVIQISKVLHEREVQLRNLKDRQEKFVKEIANNTSKLATKYHMIESKKTAETTPQPIILAQHLAQRQQQQAQNQYQQNFQPSAQRFNGVDVYPIPPGNNNATPVFNKEGLIGFHQPPSFLNRGNIQNPEVSTAATQPHMQQVQIVRAVDGKIYVHGLHQGQQMMHMPNGKLQIFTPAPGQVQQGYGNMSDHVVTQPRPNVDQVRDGPRKRSSKKKPTIISSNSSPKLTEEDQKIITENPNIVTEIKTEADDDVTQIP